MTLKDAYEMLNAPLLLLPKQPEGEFQPYLRDLLETFEQEMRASVNRLGVPSGEQLKKIKSLSHCILTAIDLSLAGKRDDALRALAEGLITVEPELFLVSSCNTSVMSGQTLYRLIRRYPKLNPKRRASVFHIPFENRELASACTWGTASTCAGSSAICPPTCRIGMRHALIWISEV